jgi:hypothetical protein
VSLGGIVIVLSRAPVLMGNQSYATRGSATA